MPVIRVPDEAEAGVQRKKPAVTGAAPVPVMGLPEGGEPGVQRTEGTSPAPCTLPPPSMMNVPEGAAASVQAESPPGLAPEPSGEGAGARPVAKASFGEGGASESAAESPPDSAAMFAAAESLAAGDAVLLALIEDAKAETGRGSIGSAGAYASRLSPGAHDVWEIAYAASALAELANLGNGAADLDITITDTGGNVICYDVSASDRLYCSWVPAWDGYFYVTVENMGGGPSIYQLVTN